MSLEAKENPGQIPLPEERLNDPECPCLAGMMRKLTLKQMILCIRPSKNISRIKTWNISPKGKKKFHEDQPCARAFHDQDNHGN